MSEEATNMLFKAISDNSMDMALKALDDGADISVKDELSNTVLELAVSKRMTELVERLLVLDKSWMQSSNKQSPVYLAAMWGMEDILTLLLKAGGSANKTVGDWGPLHHAVAYPSLGCTRILLNNGADPNVLDNSGWSPLSLAAFQGESKIAEELIMFGADMNVMDNEGDKPDEIALQEGKTETAELISGLRRAQAEKGILNSEARDASLTVKKKL